MKSFDCIIHGKFTTNAYAPVYGENSYAVICPRCLDMERNSQTDLLDGSNRGVYTNGVIGNVVEYISKEGRKDDQAKPDLSLLPKELLEEVSKAFMHGEKKYGRYNYRSGMDWHRLIAAAFRHITAFNEGEDNDSESGFSHLGHAGACIAMLLVYKTQGLGKDTRHKK